MTVREPARIAYREWPVWKDSMELLDILYSLDLEEVEPAAITSQLRRAVTSIPANIAEGAGRGGKAAGNHFKIARGSLMEVDTLVLAAERRELLQNCTPEDRKRVDELVNSVFNQLNMLISKVYSTSN